MDSQVLVALGLSLIGGFSTSIGALFVVIIQAPNMKMLGLLQGFAGGLMLSISFLDLAHNAMNSIGVIFFAIVSSLIPELSLAPSSGVKSQKKNGDDDDKDLMKKHRRQVLFSGIITAIVPFTKWSKITPYVWRRNYYYPMKGYSSQLRCVIQSFSTIEALSKGLRVGVNLALAIALHNIPEVLLLSFLFILRHKAYLFPSSLSPEVLEGLLGLVGGVMAFLTLHEMLPLAFDYAGQKQAVKVVFVGMAFHVREEDLKKNELPSFFFFVCRN